MSCFGGTFRERGECARSLGPRFVAEGVQKRVDLVGFRSVTISYPSFRLTGEGKETCPETRVEIANR